MSVGRFIIRRLLLLVPALIGVSLITFLISHVVPGDPARLMAGMEAPESVVQAIRKDMGLDRPPHIQYLEYMKRLLRGDLGRSVLNRQPVSKNLRAFFPATVELALAAFGIAALIGVPLGVITAVKKNGLMDHILRVASLAGVAFPMFWVGIILLLLFYFELGWLPIGGRVDYALSISEGFKPITQFMLLDSLLTGQWAVFSDALRHLILPAVTLAFGPLARLMRFTRAAMLEVLNAAYIQTARAKGLSERVVLLRHALRNALIPTITVMGMTMGYMLGGSVLVETIFGWPGLGKYAYDSIVFLDYPSIVAVALLATVVFMLCNLVVDVLYVFLDPRIAYA